MNASTSSKLANDHYQEWVIGSGVDPAIAALNVETIDDTEVSGTDVSYPIHERLGWQLTRFGQTARRNIRGWWVSGVDPLNDYQPMTWGRFKPDSDTPVLDREKGTSAKYLSPKREISPSRATFLRITWRIGLKVATLHGFEEEYRKRLKGFDLDREDTGFWRWVRAVEKFPVALTEGEKKAGKLLTEGYAAIALPGISSGARTKDALGLSLASPHLIPDLEAFATPDREISVCFDYEIKPRVIEAIEREIGKLKTLFTKAGCDFKVVELPGPEKGVDDFILAHGVEAFHGCYSQRMSHDRWQVKRLSRLTHSATVTLNQRYLGDLDIPDTAKLVLIKSPKGTGKTESYKKIVEEATRNGQRVLLLSHRVQLAQAICDRVGLPYVTELRTAEEGAMLGYGVCIDSLHPDSQARFDAQYWHGAIVIVDECEQFILHLLDAKTEVANRRTTILGQLKQLFINTVEGNGKIIFADADLSNISLDFAWALLEQKIRPHIIFNQYQPHEEAWQIHHYDQPNPDQWLTALCREIESGGKPFIAIQAQRAKSLWGTTTLEQFLANRYPHTKGLRVDGITVADPSHPAFECTSKLNEIAPQYDWIIASPTIETGISIDVKNHFTSVWGCLNGVTAENSARQSLARVRDPVDRHVWIRKRGTRFLANASTTVRGLLGGEQQIAQVSAKLLQTICYQEDLLGAYSSSLLIWAKFASRINAGLKHYREAVLDGLQAEGHCIYEASPGFKTADLIQELKQVREDGHKQECEEIAQAERIEQKEFDDLKSKKAKTKAERHKERKFQIAQRYQVEAVTSDLVEKDDKGWYAQLRLFYFLHEGKEFLKQRDEQSLDNALKSSGPWLPTLNRSQISSRVYLIERLGIGALLNPDQEFNGGTKAEGYQDAHPLLRKLADLTAGSRNQWTIKNLLGVTVSEKMSPIQIAQAILGKLGVRLRCDRQEGGKGQRQRLYRYTPPQDGRDEILRGWFTRDRISRDESEMHTPSIDLRDSNGGRAA